MDTLTFETGDPITLTLDQENFAEGKGNQTGSTFAKAMLTANNKTNTATEHYYVYLNITGNTFTYTQNENTPEILLTIKETNNNEITSITGLTYKTVTDGNGTTLKGFDITNQKGLITIFDNREITTTSSITEEWNVTVTYVNYNADQSANAGKSFSAKLIIQKDKYKLTLTNFVMAQYTGTQGENNIYYHDSSLENGARDNSYRYAGPSDSVNNFVCFGSITSPCPTDNLYRIIGVFDDIVKIIKYDYMTTDELGTNGNYTINLSDSGSYIDKYKGATESSVLGLYFWNVTTKTNNWNESNLNKINLNTNFINYLGEEWTNKIATTTWKVGGNSSAKIIEVVPSVAYQNEIVNPNELTTYETKIGLMYVSDYVYAASPDAWASKVNLYSGENIIGNNWMYMGLSEWTISPNTTNTITAFILTRDGDVSFCSIDNYNYSLVRAVLNLESSVAYVSGSGTQSDPIIIN